MDSLCHEWVMFVDLPCIDSGWDDESVGGGSNGTSVSEDSDDNVTGGANSDETSDSEDDDDDELYRGFVQQLKRGNQALHNDYNMLILWCYTFVFNGSPHKRLVYTLGPEEVDDMRMMHARQWIRQWQQWWA